MSIADIRKDYTKASLSESDVAPSPIEQFQQWFAEALQSELPEPTAMSLSTVDADGWPSTRVVLLKSVDTEGFTFFTNYHSRKGRAIEHNAKVALLFFWPELERQVRVEGLATRISTEESAAYFSSRPRSSQIGAWASEQSAVIPSRQTVEERFANIESRFKDQEIPLPDFWGGYKVQPVAMEFWQGRASRLHDRICYKKISDSSWAIERKSP